MHSDAVDPIPITVMSMSQNQQTWPEVLAALSGRPADLEGFVRAKGLHEKVQRVRETPGVARRLTAWVSRCCEARYGKNGGMASKIRDEGNAKFAARDNRGALKLYSESVVCSPKWGPELAWAYGNRY